MVGEADSGVTPNRRQGNLRWKVGDLKVGDLKVTQTIPLTSRPSWKGLPPIADCVDLPGSDRLCSSRWL